MKPERCWQTTTNHRKPLQEFGMMVIRAGKKQVFCLEKLWLVQSSQAVLVEHDAIVPNPAYLRRFSGGLWCFEAASLVGKPPQITTETPEMCSIWDDVYSCAGEKHAVLVLCDAKYALNISAVTLSLSTMFPLSSTKGPILVLDLVFEPAYLLKKHLRVTFYVLRYLLL